MLSQPVIQCNRISLECTWLQGHYLQAQVFSPEQDALAPRPRTVLPRLRVSARNYNSEQRRLQPSRQIFTEQQHLLDSINCTEVLQKSFQLVHNVLEICSRCVTNVFQMLSKCVLNVDQLCTLQFAMKVIWCADRSPTICWIGQFWIIRMETHTMKSESKIGKPTICQIWPISWA